MKTVEEIYASMAAEFQARTGRSAGQTGDMAVRLYAVAAQIYAMQVQADWMGRQCFPQTAAGDYLDQHAQLRGLERRAAAKAEGIIRFSAGQAADTDLAIPAGTVCMTAALTRFETAEAGVLAAGTLYADVAARAVEPGAAGNAAAGSILTMAVAPMGVTACVNPAAFAGGTDAETDGELRGRVLETFKRLPNGANAAFYEQGAMSFPEVAAAVVLPRNRGVGTVDVVVATAAGIPEETLLERVRVYFQERREIAVDVGVLTPTERTIDVSLAVRAAQGRDFESVRDAVERAVRGWFGGERLGRDVLRAELGGLVFAVEGVANYSLTAPAADAAMGRAELPRLGTLTIGRMEAGT